MIVYLAPLVFIAGLILFFAMKAPPPNSSSADVKEMGKWFLICGLLVTLLAFATEKAFHLP